MNFSLESKELLSESQFYPSSFYPKNSTVLVELDDTEKSDEVPFRFPQGFQIAAHILYNVIMILGLIGNGLVLLVFIVRRPQFRKKLPTPLLANLAIGDLLINIFCLEFGYISLLLQYWPFGKFLCFFLSPVKPIAVFISSYTLIALSVDRYLGVKNPLQSKVLSREKVKWTVGIIWILALATSLPVAFYTSYEVHQLTGLPRCGEYAWGSELEEMIYDLTLLTLQFFAPLLVLIYTYTKISIVVCQNRALRQRMSHGTSQGHSSFRTIQMSLIVVLGYIIAWLPYNVVSILFKYSNGLAESDHFPYIYVSCHWLAMSHSVLNPVIYFWLNDSFRITLLQLFCKNVARKTERRRLSSTHLSWRNSTLVTSNGRSSLSRLRQTQGTPTSEYSPSYPGSPLLALQSNRIMAMTLSTKESIEEENEENTIMYDMPEKETHQNHISESVLFTKANGKVDI